MYTLAQCPQIVGARGGERAPCVDASTDPASLLCFASRGPVPALVAAGVVGGACRMLSMLVKQTADFGADAPAGQGARGLRSACSAATIFDTTWGL